MKLFEIGRVHVWLAPTWLFGYQTLRHPLPIGRGGLTVDLCLIPFIGIRVMI